MNIIYLRVSTFEQNAESQLNQCLSIVKDFELENYKVYKEIQSAFKDELRQRPKFSKILELIKTKKVEHFIVWDLDRIYRDRAKLLGFFELCKMYNCSIISYRQKFLTAIEKLQLPKGFEFLRETMLNIFLQFLGWIAEDESRKHSDRVKKAVVRKEGEETKSYKGNRWGKLPFEIDVDEVIKLSNSGLSTREIANKIFAKKPDNTFVHPSHVTISNLLKKHGLIVNKSKRQINSS